MVMSESLANIAFPVSIWILILADLIGNTLVILIILTNKTMKSPMNYLLVNLAIADIMVGIFQAPVSILQYVIALPGGNRGQIFCKVISFADMMTWLGGATSVFSLTVICFERFFAVMHPYSARMRLNSKKVRRIVITSWLFAFTFNVPLSGLLTNYNPEKDKCIEEWSSQAPWLPKAYSFLWFIVVGLVPLSIMIVLYSRVIYSLWFKQHQVQGTQLAMLKSRKRVTKMVVTVSVVFFLSWIPTLFLYAYLGDSAIFPKNVTNMICTVMALFNSAINPFIYAFQSENFRRQFKEMVCCRKPRNNQLLPPN